MKRRLIAATCALALCGATAAPAFGDAGAPGSTFPEQPGTHVATGCNAITTGPGQGPSRDSSIALAIQTGLINDACVGG